MNRARKVGVFQKPRTVKAKGKAKTPWSIRVTVPGIGERTKVIGSKRHANIAASQLERRFESGEVPEGATTIDQMLGLKAPSGSRDGPMWSDARIRYETSNAYQKLAQPTKDRNRYTFDRFEEIIGPILLSDLMQDHLDHYVDERKKAKGRRKKSKTKHTTIRTEFSVILKLVGLAEEWGWRIGRRLRCPDLDTRTEMGRYVKEEHFARMIKACDVAKIPHIPGGATMWWRALLVYLFYTGRRIGEVTQIRTEDIDFETREVRSRTNQRKTGSGRLYIVPECVVPFIRPLATPSRELVFGDIPQERKRFRQLHKIQKAAKIHLACIDPDDDHICNDACHLYGWHAFRRAFGTLSARAGIPTEVIAAMMDHSDSRTTQQHYINFALQANDLELRKPMESLKLFEPKTGTAA